jgi:hypothetical protein
MTIFSEFGAPGSRLPLLNTSLLNAKSFTLEQLVSIHCVTSDLRWAMVELAWRSFTAMYAVAQRQFVQWVRGHRSPREEGGRGRPCCC